MKWKGGHLTKKVFIVGWKGGHLTKTPFFMRWKGGHLTKIYISMINQDWQ